MEVLERYPSPIPQCDRFLPLETVCLGQTPTLVHIMQDFMLIEEDNYTVSDAGQQHMAEGGITKPQFLACLLQAPYTWEKSPTTQLFSIIDLPFQKEGSQLCGLKLLWEMEKCTYVDIYENEVHNYCQNLIVPIVPSGQQKCFLYLDYFFITKSLSGPGQWFCHQEII